MYFINEITGHVTCRLESQLGKYNLWPDATDEFQPEMAEALSNAIVELNSQGIVPTITSGYRSAAEQLQLLQAGGPYPVARVSWHQAGLAVDLNSKAGNFSAIVDALTGQGLTWGATFSTPDRVHFQLPQAGAHPSQAMVKACEEN
jgi:hypothetical protein